MTTTNCFHSPLPDSAADISAANSNPAALGFAIFSGLPAACSATGICRRGFSATYALRKIAQGFSSGWDTSRLRDAADFMVPLLAPEEEQLVLDDWTAN